MSFNKKISWNFTIQLILLDKLRQLLQKSRCQGHFVKFSCTCPNKELKSRLLCPFHWIGWWLKLNSKQWKHQISVEVLLLAFLFEKRRGQLCFFITVHRLKSWRICAELENNVHAITDEPHVATYSWQIEATDYGNETMKVFFLNITNIFADWADCLIKLWGILGYFG